MSPPSPPAMSFRVTSVPLVRNKMHSGPRSCRLPDLQDPIQSRSEHSKKPRNAASSTNLGLVRHSRALTISLARSPKCQRSAAKKGRRHRTGLRGIASVVSDRTKRTTSCGIPPEPNIQLARENKLTRPIENKPTHSSCVRKTPKTSCRYHLASRVNKCLASSTLLESKIKSQTSQHSVSFVSTRT
jgi:hypothetical protein